MTEEKDMPGNIAVPPGGEVTTIGEYVSPPIKNVPVIAADVYSHLPAFYQSALTVMERNHRCIIEAVE
jgi:hypothetical protein